MLKYTHKTIPITAIIQGFFWISQILAGVPSNGPDKVKRSLEATRLSAQPVMLAKENGSLPVAGGFVQYAPNPGQPASQQTTIRLAYDDHAIYIAAILYDTAPDSILRELGPRDRTDVNADFFGVQFDTYDDDQNAFAFRVSAAGVQFDGKFAANYLDWSWNSVWKSKVSLHDSGWSVYLEIPYAALRFPAKTTQQWGLNFLRIITRNQEIAYWNFVDPEVTGMVHQAGVLTGIDSIRSPMRLSLTPYLSAAIEHYPYDAEGLSNYSRSFRGGLDMKYGLSESFTLDMTLIPDFGQVRSDQEILNLTPFETYYEENRPFFTEGTDLFQKAGIFYSRRIGGIPDHYEEVYDNLEEGETLIHNPTASQLVNASKVSGRTAEGTGIGIFNALTARSLATIRDSAGQLRLYETQPMTNYNILVFDQAMTENSRIGIINTYVNRFNSTRNANVTGMDFVLADTDFNYGIFGSGAISQVWSRANTDEHFDNELGYYMELSAGKVSGNLVFLYTYYADNETYDPNDLGFNGFNNETYHEAEVGYNTYEPFWKTVTTTSGLYASYYTLTSNQAFTGFELSIEEEITFSNYWTAGLYAGTDPLGSRDYYEPRSTGRYLETPPDNWITLYLATDSRNMLRLEMSFGSGKGANYFGSGAAPSYRIFNFSPTLRINNRLKFHQSLFYNRQFNDVGWVATDPDNIYMGMRTFSLTIHKLGASYIFTNRMSLNGNLYHNWSTVDYHGFYHLGTGNGYIYPDAYDGEHNINFNAFTIDLLFRWEFMPGSELTAVWKNNIYHFEHLLEHHYFRNLDQTLRGPQNNLVSMKLLYFLDYQQVKKGFVKQRSSTGKRL